MPAPRVVLTLDGHAFRRVGVRSDVGTRSDGTRAQSSPDVPPNARGTYALVLEVDREATLTVGSLGDVVFAPGRYVYCGSALGGLRARIARHLRVEKSRHWHVDYLLDVARVVEVWACESPERLECRLAAYLSSLPGASLPAPGFGSSDCRCLTHLIGVAGGAPASAPADTEPGRGFL